MKLWVWTSVRWARQHPGRAALNVVGLALGVSLYVAIAMINRATLASFDDNIRSLTGKAALSVLGGDGGFPEEALERVRRIEGVAHAAGLTIDRVHFEPCCGAESRSLTVLGIDVFADQAVRTYLTANEQLLVDPALRFDRSDSIIVTQVLAREQKLALGTALRLSTASGSQTFTVRGLLSAVGAATAYGGLVAVMDLDAARFHFGREGKLDRIDVVLGEGVTEESVAQRLSSALGSGYRVERADQQAEGVRRMVEAYQSLLGLVSLIGLLVAAFLVATTIGTALAERRREMGTLRALGATRLTILCLAVAEAAVYGLCGAGLGAPLGRLLATALGDAVSRSASAQAMTQLSKPAVAATPGDFLVGGALAVLIAGVAAIGPAWKAARVPPLAALRSSGSPTGGPSRQIFGAVVAAAAAFLLFASSLGVWSSESPALGQVQAVVGVVAVIAGSGWAVTRLVKLLRATAGRLSLGRGGGIPRLACEGLMRAPGRSGAGARTLATAFMLVILTGALNESFKTSIGGWFDRVSRSDLVVSSAGSLVAADVQPLDEDVGKELARIPGVASGSDGRPTALRLARQFYEGRILTLKAYDRPQRDDEWAIFDYHGGPVGSAATALYDAPTPAVLVSENFVSNFGIARGDVFSLDTPSGSVKFTVAGVVTDYASAEGTLYLDRDLFRRLWQDTRVTCFLVHVDAGRRAAKMRATIERTLGEERGLVVASNTELRAESQRIIDGAFAFSYAIELLALILGILSLWHVAAVGVLERTRELGVMRALGMSRRQLMAMIACESLILGVLGAAVATALGLLVARVWVVDAVSRLIGWVMVFAVPWRMLGWVLALGASSGAVAGFLPALRAGRSEIREALEYE